MFKFEIQLISTELLCYLHGETSFFPIVVCLCVYPSVCLSFKNGVRSITLKPFKIFFLEIGYKCRAPSGDVQRTRTVTPPTLLTESLLDTFLV